MTCTILPEETAFAGGGMGTGRTGSTAKANEDQYVEATKANKRISMALFIDAA
jgi:hypothetical protein